MKTIDPFLSQWNDWEVFRDLWKSEIVGRNADEIGDNKNNYDSLTGFDLPKVNQS